MKITDEHWYHGAALTQIAEHKSFTAINGIRQGTFLHRSAFMINDSIGVYFKYATKPTKAYDEYTFTFHAEHLSDLANLHRKFSKLYIALICVEAQEICCLSYELLLEMIAERKDHLHGEDSYIFLVTAPKGKKMRIYMNQPGRKGKKLTEHLIARSAFPEDLFTS